MTGIFNRLLGGIHLPQKVYWAVIICVGSAPAQSQELEPFTNRAAIYHAGWTDFNKNGKQDIFEDPTQPVNKRVEDLLSQMTVEEKTCQLATLYGYGRVLKDPAPTPEWKREIWKDGVANIDEMDNGVGKFNDPSNNPALVSPAATCRALNEVQRWFIEETRLGIPAEFSNEGVRGANYRKTVNFPAAIALGATWDRDLITAVGNVVANEAKAVGYRNIYAPILDLARDPRWGRVVESYGEDPYLVSEYGIRMTKAIQCTALFPLRNTLPFTASP
jgi:beta-glucosidase